VNFKRRHPPFYGFRLSAFLLACMQVSRLLAAQITFNPPDGLVLKKITEREMTEVKATNNVMRSAPQVIHDRTMEILVYRRTPSGFEITREAKEYERTVDGQPFENPFGKLLLNRRITLTVSREGELLSGRGYDAIQAEAKRIFPPSMQIDRLMNPHLLFALEKKMWDLDVKRFAGKSFDTRWVWREAVGLSNAPVHALTLVQRIFSTNGAVVFPVLAMESTESADLDRMKQTTWSQSELERFLGWAPGMEFWKSLHGMRINAETMVPIRSERKIRNWERREGYVAQLIEHNLETYEEIKREESK
jgi:hypothetical protein